MKFGEVRRDQLITSTPLTPTLVSLGSFQVCLGAKERVGCGNQREATAAIDPWKTPTLVPEFAMEDLPSAELQPRFLRLQ